MMLIVNNSIMFIPMISLFSPSQLCAKLWIPYVLLWSSYTYPLGAHFQTPSNVLPHHSSEETELRIVPQRLKSAQSPLSIIEQRHVTQALITLVKHALKADPSLLMDAYRHIVEQLPDVSQEPYGQNILHRLQHKPQLWEQIAGKSQHRCLVVFLDPTCPHSSQLFHLLIQLSSSVLKDWNIRPFWWSPHNQASNGYVQKALWLLSIHGQIAPFCQILAQRGLLLHQLTPQLIKDILEELGLNIENFNTLIHHPMITALLKQVSFILKELGVKSFPLMICKTPELPDIRTSKLPFRILQGCPQSKDEVVRWLLQDLS